MGQLSPALVVCIRERSKQGHGIECDVVQLPTALSAFRTGTWPCRVTRRLLQINGLEERRKNYVSSVPHRLLGIEEEGEEDCV
jgi:hypothetical protein